MRPERPRGKLGSQVDICRARTKVCQTYRSMTNPQERHQFDSGAVLRPPGTRRIDIPRGVMEGSYRCSIPLVRQSKLTSKRRGGVGKNLSDGWNLNFAIGCTHACPFCYVDPIHKRFGVSRYGDIVRQKWGDYLLVPENLSEAIEQTPWARWKGTEVMMSSTHDPYLPKLAAAARTILEHALPAGVRVCLQTRSYLVTKDLEYIAQFPDQVRLQVSIATMSRDLARLIEPRVPPPKARLEVLRRAKRLSIRTGVILAPILPPVSIRPDVRSDFRQAARALAEIGPDYIYGESMHVRGENCTLVAEALGEPFARPEGFDRLSAKMFREELELAGLRGTWWPEKGARSFVRTRLGTAKVISSVTQLGGAGMGCSLGTRSAH